MSLSASKKKLRHALRNGKMFDPRKNRGDWGSENGVTKKTPSLVERKRRQENKHKGKNRYSHFDYDYSDFYFCLL